MKSNKIARELIFEVISNQLRDDDPPETKLTYDRLIKEGYSDFETKQLIGQCVACQIFNILKFGKSFDKERYINDLNNLPKEPFE